MTISIREYTEKDYATLVHGVEALHDFITDHDPLKRIRHGEGLGTVFTQRLLKNVSEKDGAIFMAWEADRFVGFVAGNLLKQSEENLLEVIPTQLGYISHLLVEEPYRGGSVGSQLLGRMEDYFKEKGCDGIWLEVVAFNEKARRFYAKLGFVEREIGLLKDI
jgi:ribosomal protein S18 acetylase RimI-like enzyme